MSRTLEEIEKTPIGELNLSEVTDFLEERGVTTIKVEELDQLEERCRNHPG